ncbi:MAG: hypothetical protein UMU04_02335 [Halanaerobiales bacterium]|nr:hypothetical protein [Halanaerobiales bacterium]
MHNLEGVFYFIKRRQQNVKIYRRNNLNKIADALKNMETTIEINDDIMLKARNVINKMEYYNI